jgi:hypothetical protein
MNGDGEVIFYYSRIYFSIGKQCGVLKVKINKLIFSVLCFFDDKKNPKNFPFLKFCFAMLLISSGVFG